MSEAYTHCRGCGIELVDSMEKLDGLCCRPACDCYGKCREWTKRPVPRTGNISADLASPEWDIAIDEWLAATASASSPRP